MDAYLEAGRRVAKELSIINVYDEGKEALKEYAEIHKIDKSREIFRDKEDFEYYLNIIEEALFYFLQFNCKFNRHFQKISFL
jgi:hypothetical protein